MKLSSLPIGTFARVRSVVDTNLEIKLLELGVLPGDVISVLRTAPFGCPLYIKTTTQRLSIRRSEAADIIVDVLP